MSFRALALAPLLALSVGPPARAADDPVALHAEAVAAKLAPKMQRRAPRVVVEEKAEARTRSDAETLHVTTGLLAPLDSDAQLAMVLGFELGREAGDERAAAAAMRALVAAGWDGHAALRAWDRLAAATLLGADYGDGRANARRKRAAARALKSTGQRASASSGHAVGAESYRASVSAHLSGWRRAQPADPGPAPPPDGMPPPAAAREWLVYRRSGGITGWTAELRIADDGSRLVRLSNQPGDAGPRPPVAAGGLLELRGLVEQAASLPPRATTESAKWLRDGQSRSLEVRRGGAWTTISLSDGLALTDADHRLVRALEDLLR